MLNFKIFSVKQYRRGMCVCVFWQDCLGLYRFWASYFRTGFGSQLQGVQRNPSHYFIVITQFWTGKQHCLWLITLRARLLSLPKISIVTTKISRFSITKDSKPMLKRRVLTIPKESPALLELVIWVSSGDYTKRDIYFLSNVGAFAHC